MTVARFTEVALKAAKGIFQIDSLSPKEIGEHYKLGEVNPLREKHRLRLSKKRLTNVSSLSSFSCGIKKIKWLFYHIGKIVTKFIFISSSSCKYSSSVPTDIYLYLFRVHNENRENKENIFSGQRGTRSP